MNKRRKGKQNEGLLLFCLAILLVFDVWGCGLSMIQNINWSQNIQPNTYQSRLIPFKYIINEYIFSEEQQYDQNDSLSRSDGFQFLSIYFWPCYEIKRHMQLQKYQMLSNFNKPKLVQQLTDLLKVAAFNQDRGKRQEALRLLHDAHLNNDRILDGLSQLLQSQDANLHLLTYSFIFNQLIGKSKRMQVNILRFYQQVYSFIQTNGHLYKSTTDELKNRLQNIIKLATSTLLMNNFQKDRLIYIQFDFLAIDRKNSKKKQYLKKLLEQFIEKIPRVIIRKYVKFDNVVKNTIMSLINTGLCQNYEIAVDLSHFYAFFPSELWSFFLQLVNYIQTPDHLKIKILKRLYIGLNYDSISLDFANYRYTYHTARNLAGVLQGKITQEQTIILTHILSLMKNSLKSLVQKFDEETPLGKIVRTQILHIDHFHEIMMWLMGAIKISHYEDDVDQSYNNQLKDLISYFLENLPQNMVNEYINEFIIGIKQNTEEKVLFFLSGAPRAVHTAFNSDAIIRNYIKRQKEKRQLAQKSQMMEDDECHLVRNNNSFYLFLKKYIQLNKYIEPDIFQKIQSYILAQIYECEKHYQARNCEKKMLVNISSLLNILMTMSKYTKQSAYQTKVIDQTPFIKYICQKSLLYLTQSNIRQPELAHQRLYEGLQAIIQQNNKKYNQFLCKKLIQSYVSTVLPMEKFTSEELNTKTKLIQTFLILISKTLSEQTIYDLQFLPLIKRILIQFNPGNRAISKEILSVLKQYLKFYNTALINQNFNIINQVVNAQPDFLNYGLKDVILEIFQAMQISQFDDIIKNKLEYDFFLTVNQILDQYLLALKVLIELSVYTTCFNFVEDIAMELINHIPQLNKYLLKLCQQTKLKRPQIHASIKKLERLPVYLDCLVETLYLNPLWRNKHTSQTKNYIIQTKVFKICKERIDDYVAGDLTKMLKQLSIESNDDKISIDRWQNVYFDFLEGSGIGQFVEQWLKVEKYSNHI